MLNGGCKRAVLLLRGTADVAPLTPLQPWHQNTVHHSWLQVLLCKHHLVVGEWQICEGRADVCSSWCLAGLKCVLVHQLSACVIFSCCVVMLVSAYASVDGIDICKNS